MKNIETYKGTTLKEAIIANVKLEVYKRIGFATLEQLKDLPDGYNTVNGPYNVRVNIIRNEIGETAHTVTATTATPKASGASITESHIIGFDGNWRDVTDMILTDGNGYITRLKDGSTLSTEPSDQPPYSRLQPNMPLARADREAEEAAKIEIMNGDFLSTPQ